MGRATIRGIEGRETQVEGQETRGTKAADGAYEAPRAEVVRLDMARCSDWISIPTGPKNDDGPVIIN
jgi:hypothetical protein